MKIRNIGSKIIGIGEETVLPGEVKEVPKAEPKMNNPVTEKDDLDDAAAAEALRQARLASLKGITDEALGSLAIELGINPAECKDQADVLKKVKAALK